MSARSDVAALAAGRATLVGCLSSVLDIQPHPVLYRRQLRSFAVAVVERIRNGGQEPRAAVIAELARRVGPPGTQSEPQRALVAFLVEHYVPESIAAPFLRTPTTADLGLDLDCDRDGGR